MGLKRKLMLVRQKEYLDQKLQERLTYVTGKGIEPKEADKDPILRKLKAGIKAVNKRMKLIADSEKITADMAKLKADRAAALVKEKEGGKAEKPKKGPEEGKEKKAKGEKKPGPSKGPEGGKGQKPAGPPEEGKAPQKKKAGETGGETAGPAKTEK